MAFRTLLGCALLCQCFVPLAHAAERVPGACPTPGTVIVTSINETYAIRGGDGLYCWVRSSTPGRPSHDFGAFSLVTEVGSMCYIAAKDQIAKLWPLEVGKVVRFSAESGNYAWTSTYTVTEKKDITVKAGTFPVYVVVYDEEQRNGPYHSIWTSYISTDVGYRVKVDYASVSGGPSRRYPHTPWEAVSIIRTDAPAQRSQ